MRSLCQVGALASSSPIVFGKETINASLHLFDSAMLKLTLFQLSLPVLALLSSPLALALPGKLDLVDSVRILTVAGIRASFEAKNEQLLTFSLFSIHNSKSYATM